MSKQSSKGIENGQAPTSSSNVNHEICSREICQYSVLLSIAYYTALLIGCASHRFNLAVKSYLKDSEDILEKINNLMKKLSTLKGGAALRRKTKLTALTRNETRWSSIFKMVERMIEIQPFMTLAIRNTSTCFYHQANLRVSKTYSQF